MTINEPIGVTTDASGHLFVSWFDAFNGSIVTEFDSSANPLASILVDPGLNGPGYLATYPSGGQVLTPGQIVYLGPNGVVAALNPDLSGGHILGSLQATPANTTDVYDVENQQFLNLTGYLTTNTANYGDIAISIGSQYEDWLVTGISNGPAEVPFVERLRWQGSQLQSVQVVATSLGAEPGFNDYPRGVAVNSNGTVLTTFPHALDYGEDPVDFLVAFGVSFPEGQGPLPYRPYGAGADTSTFSKGMTTDHAGNFLVATGEVGSVYCGIFEGIVVVPADLTSSPACIPVTQDLLYSRDVALSPDDSVVYMTVASPIYFGQNSVLRLPYGRGGPSPGGQPSGQPSSAPLLAFSENPAAGIDLDGRVSGQLISAISLIYSPASPDGWSQVGVPAWETPLAPRDEQVGHEPWTPARSRSDVLELALLEFLRREELGLFAGAAIDLGQS